MATDAERLWTDRTHLTTQAYVDSANLAARQSIYQYADAPADLVGWALGHAPLLAGQRVLDLGCGPGTYLRRLAPQPGLQLIGMDLSRGMLADLRRDWDSAHPYPALIVGDAQAIPLPDAHCDLALAMHMLYHVPDIERAASELRRVIRPGGTLLAASNADDHLGALIELFEGAAAACGMPPDTQTRLVRRFRLEDGAGLLGSAFTHIDRYDLASQLVIPEAGPVLHYLNSIRATREAFLPAGATWADLMAEAGRRVAATIAAEGAFRVRTHAGVLVCR